MTMYNETETLFNSPESQFKKLETVTMGDTNSISKYILSETENKCPHNKLGYMSICVFIRELFISH